jgi:hypothetical protein
VWSATARCSIAALAAEETNAEQLAIEHILLPNIVGRGKAREEEVGC